MHTSGIEANLPQDFKDKLGGGKYARVLVIELVTFQRSLLVGSLGVAMGESLSKYQMNVWIALDSKLSQGHLADLRYSWEFNNHVKEVAGQVWEILSDNPLLASWSVKVEYARCDSLKKSVHARCDGSIVTAWLLVQGEIGYGMVSDALSYKFPSAFARMNHLSGGPLFRIMLEIGVKMITRDCSLNVGHLPINMQLL
ncbi:hypothetical protein C5167_011932 [Papaver somniferum]|uniref:Uncharacterized protein n=1 Tax=Papaver somniferum TaxID=3469 RepID=A0A4Y7IWP3_PAPSO|nr:hypothetical protein C5167_011932 [Papaver somniferum]